MIEIQIEFFLMTLKGSNVYSNANITEIPTLKGSHVFVNPHVRPLQGRVPVFYGCYKHTTPLGSKNKEFNKP